MNKLIQKKYIEILREINKTIFENKSFHQLSLLI